MALGQFAKRIALNRRAANRLRKVAHRRHLRAAWLARQALIAKQNGRHTRAQNLLQRALRLKAAAARAGVRAMIHRARIPKLRRARILHAQRMAGRV
jgi:hypothetical protein